MGTDEEISALDTSYDNALHRVTNKKELIFLDADDYERCKRYTWRLVRRSATYYAVALVKGREVYLHRYLMGLAYGDPRVVDHINGRGWDCRKANMRITTKAVNNGNVVFSRTSSSGYTGVYPMPNGRFISRIRINGVRCHVGIFDTAEEAARAYDKAARGHRGIATALNFPEEAGDE